LHRDTNEDGKEEEPDANGDYEGDVQVDGCAEPGHVGVSDEAIAEAQERDAREGGGDGEEDLGGEGDFEGSWGKVRVLKRSRDGWRGSS
jgi:hypothetical protein